MLNNGIIIIDKPSGITTNQAIQILKRQLNISKIGHAGTLDPLASGVVIGLVNTGTKLSDYLLTQQKEYVVTGKLYVSTDSYDSDGNILEVDENHNVTLEQLKEVINKYNGLNYNQTPPIYSAIKVNGKKLYEYAREDKDVEIKKRNVTIEKLELLDWNEQTNEFTLKALVSKGTYIRSLIVDIAKDLGTIGHVTILRRTKSGPFSIENSHKIEEISMNNLITNYEVVKLNDYKLYNMNVDQFNDVMLGKKTNLPNLTDDVVYLVYNEELIAIYHREKDDLFRSLKGGFKQV